MRSLVSSVLGSALTTALVLLAAAWAPALRAQGGGLDLSAIELPDGFLELSDLVVYGGGGDGMRALATTELLGASAEVFVAIGRGDNGQRTWLLGLQPERFSLGEAIPALANPVLDGLVLSGVTLVATNRSTVINSADLPDDEYWFYQPAFQRDEFSLTLNPGVNLFGTIPTENLPDDHPLGVIMNALGIEQGGIFLQGTLGESLTMLANPGAGGLDVIKDLYLRAELPPMRPPGSPAWFQSGQLALELTGDPAVRMVGEINVTIEEDDLQFFLAAMLSRAGASLSGGLRTEDGWNQPFGIEWLIINEVVLSLGITPAGSIQPGFAGDLVIGEKDIAVAVAVAISPAGVPTNFIFEGESEAGLGLTDLAELQARMRAAADAAGGVPSREAVIPLDALPEISFRDLGLKFAPKASPELGVERGMAIKGELWLGPPGQEPSNFAAVDVNVGEDGMWVRGNLAAFELGPLTWSDALLDLTATPDDQHLIVSGEVELFSARQLVDLELSREQLRFRTETELYDLFRMTLEAQSVFNLRSPSFQIDGVAETGFAEVLAPIVREAAELFGDDAERLMASADAVLTAFQQTLSASELTVQQLQTVLEQQRAAAEAVWRANQAAANQAAAAARAALSRRNAAYRAWRNTPFRQRALKASRRRQWTQAIRTHVRSAATYGARAAVARAALAVYRAIPPVDENILIQRAETALSALRAQAEQAQASLTTLREGYAALSESLRQGELPLTIERAEVHANLDDMLRGQAVRWHLSGTFLSNPFVVDEALDFSDINAAAGTVFQRLMGFGRLQ